MPTREMQVLRAWFASPSKDCVAAQLHITVKTVDTYIAAGADEVRRCGAAGPHQE